MKYFQQGDVVLFVCEEIKGQEVKDKVLAYGEATGHHHRVITEDAKVFEENGVKYVLANNKTEIKHEEHGTITLEPGKYRVGRVREYDHFLEESRRVVD